MKNVPFPCHLRAKERPRATGAARTARAALIAKLYCQNALTSNKMKVIQCLDTKYTEDFIPVSLTVNLKGYLCFHCKTQSRHRHN